MFDFDSVADAADRLVEYAEAQFKWAEADLLGDEGEWKAKLRGRRARAAATAIRGFLHSAEIDSVTREDKGVPCS